MQDSTLRIILGFFRIASIDVLKIESIIPSVKICMHRKMQKYALRTMKMIENYSIRIRILIFYLSEYQNRVFDEHFIQWDKNGKKHVCQINRILNVMASHINWINIEKNEIWIKSCKEIKHWLKLKIDRINNFSIELSIQNSSNKLDKKLKTKIKI